MLTIEKTDVVGLEHAIRGMRNPMNSWRKSDSGVKDIRSSLKLCGDSNKYQVGPNDLNTMVKLAKGGPVHGKFKRMICVYVDITAPLYWWKEFDTYKIGTVANSCSTMHKIHAKQFTLDDFSHEHLISDQPVPTKIFSPLAFLEGLISALNKCRKMFLDTNDKIWWWQMIQLLPSSYNQKRTVLLNYEVLTPMYRDRKNHKLDEWHTVAEWIENLPFSELITLKPEYV